MEGPLDQVLPFTLQSLVKLKIASTSKDFVASNGVDPCVQAAHKADEGYLFMLSKSFFFVKKPILHLLHEDITRISFSRLDQDTMLTQTFDLQITINVDNPTKINQHQFVTYEFTISNTELAPCVKFMIDKHLPIVDVKRVTKLLANLQRHSQDSKDDQRRMDELLLLQRTLEEANENDEDDEDFAESVTSDGSDDGVSTASDDEDDEDDEDEDTHNMSDSQASSSDNSAGDTHSNKHHRKRSKHGKDYVKKPMNAYMCYVNSVRAAVQSEFPNEKITQIMKTISERWKQLSEQDRSVYHEMAKQDQQRYRRQLDQQTKLTTAVGPAD
uniref:FACT complex subunit SSRP1 n=1 Tax=Lygus hesperus TaxID=30085 RepID=A0A146KPC4_LYGHE